MSSAPPAESAAKSARRRVIAVASATFFAAGISTASLGPALPELARNANAQLATLGAVFTVLYGGGLVSQLVTGAIVDRVGHRPVLVAGPALAGVGMIGIVAGPSLAVVLAAGFLMGLGYGALIVGANLVVADTFEDGGAGELNLTNVFFGVGAIAGPAAIGVLLATLGTSLPVLWAAAGVLFLVSASAFALHLPWKGRRASGHRGGEPGGPVATPSRRGALRSLLTSPLMWIFGLILLLYVGNEGAMGAWLATYLGETAGTPLDQGALATSGFWLALTAGRLLAAVASTRLDAPRLLLVSICGALAGGVGLVLGVGSAPVTIAAAIVLGLSFGPIYPTTIALVAIRFPTGTGTVAGVVMTLGSLGGAVLPWLYGILILQVSPLAGIVLIPISVTVMLGLWAAARHLGWRPVARPVAV
jgi:fucose permease